jgi:hypothetical protein
VKEVAVSNLGLPLDPNPAANSREQGYRADVRSIGNRLKLIASDPMDRPKRRAPHTGRRQKITKRSASANLASRRLDLDIDPGWQAQLVQCFDRLSSRLYNVDQPLVSADLELLASLFVDEWAR